MTNNVDANKILLGERGVPISPKIADAIKPLLTPAQVETQDYLGIVVQQASPLPPPDPTVETEPGEQHLSAAAVDPVLLKQTRQKPPWRSSARTPPRCSRRPEALARMARACRRECACASAGQDSRCARRPRARRPRGAAARLAPQPDRLPVHRALARSRSWRSRPSRSAASAFLAFTNYNVLSPNLSWVGLDNFTTMLRTSASGARSARRSSSPSGRALKLVFALRWRCCSTTRGAACTPIGPRTTRRRSSARASPSRWSGARCSARADQRRAGAGAAGTAWLGDPATAIWTVILLAVWEFGSPMLIFLAGLRQIPTEFYEAAAIDGAGRCAAS